MKRIYTSLIIAFIFLLIFYKAGSYFFLSQIRNQVDEYGLKAERSSDETRTLINLADLLKTQKKNISRNALPKSILQYNKESILVRSIFEAASGTNVKIESFEMLKGFFLKGKNPEEPAPQTTTPNLDPSQLDDQGMPIGALKSQDDSEWKGFEILPLKLVLKSENFKSFEIFKSFGMFFGNLGKALPLFGVHTFQLSFPKSGNSKATAILVFPLKEGSSKEEGPRRSIETSEPENVASPTNFSIGE